MISGASTNPFHLFALIRGDIPALLVDALEEAHNGNEKPLADLLSKDTVLATTFKDEDCSLSAGRNGCPKSDSTLLFIGLTPLDENRERVRMERHPLARERLGRYPYGDGNALTYLLEWASRTDLERGGKSGDFPALIDKLNSELRFEKRGHKRFCEGDYADLWGYLTGEECEELDKLLRKGEFKILADEPLDGGVADITRHLKSVVRSAARHKLGLLHYTH